MKLPSYLHRVEAAHHLGPKQFFDSPWPLQVGEWVLISEKGENFYAGGDIRAAQVTRINVPKNEVHKNLLAVGTVLMKLDPNQLTQAMRKVSYTRRLESKIRKHLSDIPALPPATYYKHLQEVMPDALEHPIPEDIQYLIELWEGKE